MVIWWHQGPPLLKAFISLGPCGHGIPCPEGFMCVDDPTDDCDPTQGHADCQGQCMKKGVPILNPPSSVRKLVSDVRKGAYCMESRWELWELHKTRKGRCGVGRMHIGLGVYMDGIGFRYQREYIGATTTPTSQLAQ